MRDEIRLRGNRLVCWGRRGTEDVAHLWDADSATFSLPQQSPCGLEVQRIWQTKLVERCEKCEAFLEKALRG